MAGSSSMDLNTLEFTAVIALGSSLAGFLGSLTGLGGGIVIVPLRWSCRGYSLRDWSFSGFRHCDFFGSGGGLCPGRL